MPSLITTSIYYACASDGDDRAEALHPAHSRRRHRRSARAPRAHALPRRAAARAVVHRHQRRLYARLVDYWQNGFDWRAWEAQAQRFPQFTLPIGGIDLHFIHAPSTQAGRDAAAALARLAGLGVRVPQARLPLLTEHFTVVAPSLPGYTLSFKPGSSASASTEIADLYAELMTDARLRAFRRAGRRLGRLRRVGDGPCASAARHRHPSQSAAVRRDPKMLDEPERRRRRSISTSSTIS